MRRSLKALLATTTLLAGIKASDAAVRIMDDPSGRIGTYVNRYKHANLPPDATWVPPVQS